MAHETASIRAPISASRRRAAAAGRPLAGERQARSHPLRRLGEGASRSISRLLARRAAEHRSAVRRRRPCREQVRRPRRRSACRCRARSAMRCSTGAVCAPSATVRRSAISSAALRPSPIALPSEKLRLLVEEQVSTRSPRPDRPASVSRRPPIASPKRVISAKPRAISAARAFWPSPRPSATPQAIASTFLTAPPTSAPATSSVQIGAEVRQG